MVPAQTTANWSGTVGSALALSVTGCLDALILVIEVRLMVLDHRGCVGRRVQSAMSTRRVEHRHIFGVQQL